MLIESYALETTWSIVSTILAGVNSPIAYLFAANDSNIKVRMRFSHHDGISHTPPVSRSSPTFSLFIVLQPGEGGRRKQMKKSAAYGGTAIHKLLPRLKSVSFIPGCLQRQLWQQQLLYPSVLLIRSHNWPYFIRCSFFWYRGSSGTFSGVWSWSPCHLFGNHTYQWRNASSSLRR